MFAQTFIITALAAFAVAGPLQARTGDNKCNTGTVQCCNHVEKSDSAKVSKIASLLQLDIKGIVGEVGLQCSPVVSLVGGGPNSGQTVCCDQTKFNGAVNLGCSPINVGL
ncbi:hydrophobin 3 [Pleurotus eryngii]|uniref:Hydrophobin n=1 Tax=Pleurotus eryngii TaxID=5323 RepID=A0A9P5ZP19_PLEER|nr:hydrophobin 3 [Pleurotus eryngii]